MTPSSLAALNGIGWEIQQFIPKGNFSHVSEWGWKRSASFPDVYDTFGEAKVVMDRRLKGSVEYRVYEVLE